MFGILSSRFGVFKKAIPLEPEKNADQVILFLHNISRSKPYSRGLLHIPNILIMKTLQSVLHRPNGDRVDLEWLDYCHKEKIVHHWKRR